MIEEARAASSTWIEWLPWVWLIWGLPVGSIARWHVKEAAMLLVAASTSGGKSKGKWDGKDSHVLCRQMAPVRGKRIKRPST